MARHRLVATAGSDAAGSRATLGMAEPSVLRTRRWRRYPAVPERLGGNYRGTEGAGEPDDGREGASVGTRPL